MEGKTLEQLTDERAEAKIAAALSDDIVGIDELRPHPSNPRRGNIAAIASSLDRFGQVKPVLALKDGTIVAGHHVYYAARHLGWDRVAALKVDMDPAKAEAYLLADNRISELGGYDGEGLARLLEDVDRTTGLEGTGYKPEDLKKFLADVESPEQLGGGGGGRGPESKVCCPMCGAEVE